MPNAKELDGLRCLITGASRGLGAALAERFSREGARLLLTARNADALEKLAASLPGRSEIFPADLSAPGAPEAIARRAGELFGSLDALVNNAGVHGCVGPFADADPAGWERAFAVNLLAPARLTRLCVPLLRKTGRGKIIFLSGGGASGPRENFTAYAASKTAIVRFAETLAAELKSSAIDVNCLAPGAMPTDLLREVAALGPGKAGAKECEAAAKTLDSGSGAATLEKASALAVYLASRQSDGLSGKLISAVWDDWRSFGDRAALTASEIYTLRRVAK